MTVGTLAEKSAAESHRLTAANTAQAKIASKEGEKDATEIYSLKRAMNLMRMACLYVSVPLEDPHLSMMKMKSLPSPIYPIHHLKTLA